MFIVLVAQPGHLLERVRLVLFALPLHVQPRPASQLRRGLFVLALRPARPAQLVNLWQLVPVEQRARWVEKYHVVPEELRRERWYAMSNGGREVPVVEETKRKKT